MPRLLLFLVDAIIIFTLTSVAIYVYKSGVKEGGEVKKKHGTRHKNNR